MELMGKDLLVHVSTLSHNAPNQEMSFLNEDVTIATEVVTEKPEFVEIEKELVIQKQFIVKEKILVPKPVTYSASHSFGGHTSLFTEGNDSLFEVSIHNSEESGKMEIASQESKDSRMEISSQESSLSQMEYSSQEVDIPIKPISDDYVQSKGKLDVEEAACKAKSFKGNGVPINEASVLSTEESLSEKCLWRENDSQIDKGDVLNGEEEVLKENIFQGEVFKANLEAKSGVSKRKVGISADGMKLRTDRSLLSREEAVAARERACLSREKAIKERESAFVSQGSGFSMVAANDSPSPKRLKLIGVFECS